MNKVDMKKMIRDCLEVEKELYEFGLECIKHIFGADNHCVIHAYESTADGISEGYGLSLKCFLANDENRKNRIEKQRTLEAEAEQDNG